MKRLLLQFCLVNSFTDITFIIVVYGVFIYFVVVPQGQVGSKADWQCLIQFAYKPIV